ncbi:hypothetical protein ABZ016_23390 [Streptomyces sp. NPDC006372]|uniref:hypothetical protein n=1 Tax=Streptomyces sp. NPDC006372 TaxID=3155599 RepID=UPI0033B56E92
MVAVMVSCPTSVLAWNSFCVNKMFGEGAQCKSQFLRESITRPYSQASAAGQPYASAEFDTQQLQVLDEGGRLERPLGAALFVRVCRGLRLTGAGEVLARNTATILDAISATQEQITAMMRGPAFPDWRFLYSQFQFHEKSWTSVGVLISKY